ncbi:hypothetical protein pb186bvf_015879 [Paramecium bursaria]
MIKLRIEKNLTIRGTENDLSGLLVAKSSVRNYSQSTRSTKVQFGKPPIKRIQTNQNNEQDSETRTYSVQEINDIPLIEKKMSENNVSIQRPRHSRKLIHIQTSPSGLDRKSQFEQNAQNIIYDQIDIQIQIPDTLLLYKGFRSLQNLQKITVISFNLLFGTYSSFGQIDPKVATIKQIINRIKQDSILVLLLNPKQKLQSVQTAFIDMMDAVVQLQSIKSKDPLSYKKYNSHLFYKIDNLQQQLKLNIQIKRYLIIDEIQDVYDSYINKILITNNDDSELLHLYLHRDKLSKLFSLLGFVKLNQLPQNTQKLDLVKYIEKSIVEQQQIQETMKLLQSIEETKVRIKSNSFSYSKNEYLSAEQRAEKFRDNMILYIKNAFYYR